MPSFYPKRNTDTAPAIHRVREFFRKKRDDVAHHDGDAPSPTLRELLQQDRGDLLRDIERIFEVHNSNKSFENLSLPSLQQATGSYRSSATQTDAVEEAAEPATTAPQSDAATQCQSPNYISSSTDIDDLRMAEIERPSLVVEKLPSLPAKFGLPPTPSGSPPASNARLPFVFKFPTDSIADTVPSAPKIPPPIFHFRGPILTPRTILNPKTMKSTSSSISSPGERTTDTTSSDKRDVIRSEKRIVDKKTGKILVSRLSMVKWPGRAKRIPVRLPPQASGEEDDTDEDTPAPEADAASSSGNLGALAKGASDIEQMKEMIETLARGGQWIVLDDEDDGDDESEVTNKKLKMRR